jgi:hypothetical protein
VIELIHSQSISLYLNPNLSRQRVHKSPEYPSIHLSVYIYVDAAPFAQILLSQTHYCFRPRLGSIDIDNISRCQSLKQTQWGKTTLPERREISSEGICWIMSKDEENCVARRVVELCKPGYASIIGLYCAPVNAVENGTSIIDYIRQKRNKTPLVSCKRYRKYRMRVFQTGPSCVSWESSLDKLDRVWGRDYT